MNHDDKITFCFTTDAMQFKNKEGIKMMTLPRYEGKSKEVVLSITNSATNYLFANQAFSEALATNKIIDFFQDLNKKK